jgi:molybdopterin biosynthesis enzyme
MHRLLTCIEGLPLSILVAMYLVVRPLVDALEGVDRKRASPVFPSRQPTVEEALHLEKLKDPNYKPTAHPQGVRWFNGILAAPAPRDPDRHWVQLARFDHSQPGRVGLIPLPSEEWRVSSMAEAEAMVAIEKGEGDMPVGSEVQFFLLD